MDTSKPTKVTAELTRCCPMFEPASFDDKEIVWGDELFVREHVPCLLHVPLDFSGHVTMLDKQVKAAKATPAEPLMLCDQVSPWGTDLYARVARPVPGSTMVTLPGRYRTKVFEGPFTNAPKWSREMDAHLAQRGERAQKLFYVYTTCPSCAKAYGVSHVVVFAKVA